MKGKVVAVMKKWWLTALILALALSLTSCSRTYPTGGATYGFGTCTGTIGDFDVYTLANYDSGRVRMIIIPYTLDAEGDIATIAIGAQSGAYKILVEQVALQRNVEIVSEFYESEYNNYPILAITSYVPGDYSTGNPQKEARCYVPEIPYY